MLRGVMAVRFELQPAPYLALPLAGGGDGSREGAGVGREASCPECSPGRVSEGAWPEFWLFLAETGPACFPGALGVSDRFSLKPGPPPVFRALLGSPTVPR